jgi:CheY-like chemotaxis protein
MNDVQEIVDLLQELLEEEGYRVSTSLYVLDLEKVRRLKPDLLVLDIFFEGEDKGWQFLTLSRLDRVVCRIPVILCTAAVRTVREMEDHLREQGVTVVPKPFDVDRLVREIGERLGSQAGSVGNG